LYLDELGRPETANPHEAALSRSLPDAGNKVKDVGFGHHSLEVDNDVIMGQAIVYVDLELVFW